MSPAGQDLRALFRAVGQRVRRDVLLAVAAGVAALVPAALLLGWLAAGLSPWAAPSAGPLLVDALALAAALLLGWWARRRWLGEASDERVGAAVEQARHLPRGSVRGVLELTREVPQGTSPALARNAEVRLSGLLAGARRDELARAAGAGARRRLRRATGSLLGLGALVMLLGLVAPERSRVGWAPLLRPLSTLVPPPLPGIAVEPGDARVPRGGSLTVRIRAPGRPRVTLAWRTRGEVRQARAVALRGARGAGVLAGIDAPTRYWVEAPDGAVSDTFTVVPREALLVAGLSFELRYPGYLRRDPERFEGELPAVDIPEGTVVTIRGRATRSLGEAALSRGDSTRVSLAVDGVTFAGRWVPRVSGRYVWRLRGEDGADAEILPPPLELNVVADSPPSVELTFPGVDTVLAADLRQPIAAAAGDDHGLRAAELVSWRVSALGRKGEPVSQALAVGGEAQRALIQGTLDASQRGLLPGDTLFYFVRVTDNSPRAQTGTSATYRLRLPGAEEMRRQVQQEMGDAAKQAEQAASAAKELERETRDLQRRGGVGQARRSGGTGRAGEPGRPSPQSMDFAQAQEARRILDQQDALMKQAEAMRARSQELQRAAEQAGLSDPELQKRLAELTRLYDEVLTPEMRAKLEELRKALADLDAERVNEALQQLAQAQEQFRKNLEESLALMRRAAVEQQLNSLSQDAKELATQQRSLAEQMKDATSPVERTEQQKALSARADSLRQALSALQQRLQQQREDAAAKRTAAAAQDVDSARAAMQRAAQAASQRQGEAASRSGQQAASQLDSVSQALASQRRELAQQWRQEVQQAVDQATSDALALAQRQDALLRQMKEAAGGASAPRPPRPPQPDAQQSGESGAQSTPAPQPGRKSGEQGEQSGGASGKQQGQRAGGARAGDKAGGAEGGRQQGERGRGGTGGDARSGDYDAMRAEQAAVQEGLEQLGRNLSEAGRRSAMVNKDVAAALSRASGSMRRTLNAMEQGENGRRLPIPEAGQTLDALNRLALSLLSNQQQIAQSESGTGVQQALEQLSQLAKQQGSLNGQTSALLPLQLSPQAMQRSVQSLSSEQRAIADQLQSLEQRPGDTKDALGDVGAMKKEAEQLARDLAGGRVSPDVLQRQEQLFHHLLDAGRTLERDEYSQQRVSQGPGNTPLLRPDAIDPSKIGDGVRYPVPTPAQLRGLPPAYRRLILEYFERLNRGPGGGR